MGQRNSLRPGAAGDIYARGGAVRPLRCGGGVVTQYTARPYCSTRCGLQSSACSTPVQLLAGPAERSHPALPEAATVAVAAPFAPRSCAARGDPPPPRPHAATRGRDTSSLNTIFRRWNNYGLSAVATPLFAGGTLILMPPLEGGTIPAAVTSSTRSPAGEPLQAQRRVITERTLPPSKASPPGASQNWRSTRAGKH